MDIIEGNLELHLHIQGVEVHLLEVHMQLTHLEHLGEDMAKEGVIITDLGTIMCQMAKEDLQGLLKGPTTEEEIVVLEAAAVGTDRKGVGTGDQDTEVVESRCNP